MNPDRISENFCFYLDPCRRAVLSLPDPAAMQRYPFRILLLWILCGSLPPCSAIPSGSLPPCSAVLPDHAAVDPVRIPAGVQCYPFRILLLCSAVLLDHAAVDPVRILAAVQCYPFRILPLWILCGSLPPCSAVLLDHAAMDPVRILAAVQCYPFRILPPCSAIPSGSCCYAALSFWILPLWFLCGSLPPCSAVLLDHAAVDPVRILQPCSAIPSGSCCCGSCADPCRYAALSFWILLLWILCGSCSRAVLSLPDPAAVQRYPFRILQPCSAVPSGSCSRLS